MASGLSGRPAHLLEKDVWVVHLLQILYASEYSSDLTVKGGTSLSKPVLKGFDKMVENSSIASTGVDLMIGAGRALHEMTKLWVEAKIKARIEKEMAEGWAEGRAEGWAEGRAEGRAEGQAKVLNIFDMIAAEPEGSEYRAKLERYFERMREAISNNETLDEPLPLRTELDEITGS